MALCLVLTVYLTCLCRDPRELKRGGTAPGESRKNMK